MLAYLDTNVFDNLIKKTNDVTEAHERQLRTAVSSGHLKIVVSHINIRESLAALGSRPEIARAQLGLIASLANWGYFVRFHSAILEDDIRHFAYNGERANTPFEESRNTANIRSKVQLIVDGRIGLEELEAVIGEDREQKRIFHDRVKKSNAEIAADLEEFRKAHGIPSFEQFLEDVMEAQVRAFVESFGVSEECDRRGLDKLLRIPSIRAMIGLGMSFMYRTAVEKKSPKSSASRDLQHAVCAAAAADIFVTHDKELAFLLNRVPIKGFQVLRLQQLLEDGHCSS